MALGKSALYYKRNPEAAKRKAAYDKKLNARPKQKSKRAELGRIRTKDENKGRNIKGKDYDHATGRYETPKVNRGRKGEGGRKKTKR